MIFEGTDGSFGGVCRVFGGRHGVVLVDASHNFVVSYDTVDVASGLEGFDKNGVGRLVVGDHDVFITEMGVDREADREAV